MTVRVRTGMTVLAVMLAGVLLSATAAEAGFLTETRDPAGDSTDPDPARDLTGAGIGFDRKSGYMVAVVALRGTPGLENRAFVSVYAGTRTSSGCTGLPAAGFGAFTDGSGATWFRQDSPSRSRHGEADKSGYRSTIQKFEIRDRRLAGKKWDCLGAILTDPENPDVVFDRVPMVFFKGIPAMALRMPKVRRPIPPNRVRQLRIVIRNPGDGPLRNVKLRVLPDHGLKVVPRVRNIPLIRPHTRRAVRVRVRLFRSAGDEADLKVLVRSGELRARAKTTLRLKLPKEPPEAGGGGNAGGGGGTCVQYFPDFSGETGGSLGLVPC